MPEKEFDAIIIGSGIGGLSCAASLAMCDYKVLVLEKNRCNRLIINGLYF
jgi:phytoene dehydrogenase-like protein